MVLRLVDVVPESERVPELSFAFPGMRIVSEKNMHEHWRYTHRRVKRHRNVATLTANTHLRQLRRMLPIVVRITRIAPRDFDAEDNLPRALSAIRDGIAASLGIDDRDPRVSWEYAQERGAPKGYGVRVDVWGRGGSR